MLRGIARKSVGVVTCVYHLCCVVLKRTFEWDWVKCMQSSHGPAPCQCPLADHLRTTWDTQSYSDDIRDTLTGEPVADSPGTTKDSQSYSDCRGCPFG